MEITRESLIENYSLKNSEELLTLHSEGNITELAYEALEQILLDRGVTIPLRPLKPADIKSEDPLREYWRGNRSLARAFWLVGILGSIILALLIKISIKPLALLFASAFGNGYLASILILLITFCYMLFATVSIWRCAKKSQIWGWIVRISILGVFVGIPMYFFAAIIFDFRERPITPEECAVREGVGEAKTKIAAEVIYDMCWQKYGPDK